MAGWALADPAFAQRGREQELAVLYPDVAEPFSSFFARILDGIDDRFKTRVQRVAVPANPNIPAMVADLRQRQLRVVIALGRVGLRVANALEKTDVVAGCVVSVSEAEARDALVLSLAPDPALLLRRLKGLLPNARSVTVAYSAANSGWLMGMARDASHALGLELHAAQVADPRAAMQVYQSYFAQATPRDALWLPQDSLVLDESAMLPQILQECWGKTLPMFSSNSSHVSRGALFSLLANNHALGRSLGAMAQARLAAEGASRGLLPMRDVVGALNTRTASHLGVEITAQLRQDYEVLLPERSA
jgi:putative ABC transport system substrate-binding protein